MAPGPGRSTVLSTLETKLGGMQKTPTSLATWASPSVRLPPGNPVSVIVWALLPRPNAPALCCTQSGHVPPPSVQSPFEVHALGVVNELQVPVPDPVQHGNGVPPPVQAASRGHPDPGSPSKQVVFAPSRQKPQKTLLWPLAGLFTAVRLD